MPVESNGPSSRGPVHTLLIGSPPGPVLEVLDLGATVHRLFVTGGDGVRRNVVLGHATPQEYLDSLDYVGGTIGRYANRIRDGRFVLDGTEVQLATNERGHHLHGGPVGFDKRWWQVEEHSEDQLELGLTSPRGDQGFPGELIVRARFTVTDDAVRLELSATTDEPTVVCLTSHAYLNLDGDGSGSVGDQRLSVAAHVYLPTDGGIPLQPTPVAGTRFDLRVPTSLGDPIGAGGYDHCFLLDDGRPAAVLESPATRTRMELSTDQPGLQVYTGGGFDGSQRSTEGIPYHPGAGVALEPQLPPDSPNRPDLEATYGSAVLRPGDTWRSTTQWRFTAMMEG